MYRSDYQSHKLDEETSRLEDIAYSSPYLDPEYSPTDTEDEIAMLRARRIAAANRADLYDPSEPNPFPNFGPAQ